MKRQILYIAAAVLLFGAFIYASRGPDISNVLKRIILPELENATGRKFIAQQIYINLFPLFAEIKGLKSFDDNGEKIIEVQRVKGYIGLLGLLRKKIVVERLVLKEPDIRADAKQIEEISANIRKYLDRGTKAPFKVDVKSFTAADGAVSYRDSHYSLLLGGFDADVTLGRIPRFRVLSKRVVFDKEGLNEAKGSLDALFFLKDKLLDLQKLTITSYNSEMHASGSLDTDTLAGKLLSEATVYLDTVKKIFGLKRSGEGQLTFKGSIGFGGAKKAMDSIFADVKVKGDLAIETLMELLKVKERIAGHVSVDGSLKGFINGLHGEGQVVLDKGDLFGVPVEQLKCKVLYQDGAMRFLDGIGLVLHGKAYAEGMIRLPVVSYFEVKVRGEDVSSEGLLKLAGLNRILPEGKISGTLATAGKYFDPRGQFYYRATVPGRDVLGRIKEVKSLYSMKDEVLSFDGMSFVSDKSSLYANGSLDLKTDILNFQGEGQTADIGDLTAPYFTSLSGPAHFSHAVSGSVKDPVIDMHFDARHTNFAARDLVSQSTANNSDFIFDTVEGDLKYKKNELILKHFSASSRQEKISASGTVLFPRAASLFDLSRPDFNLSVSARDVAMKPLAGMISDKVRLSGILNTDFNLSGGVGTIKLSGNVGGRDITVSDQYLIDGAEGYVVYEGGAVNIKSLHMRKGASAVYISGSVGPNKRFSLDARSELIKVSDIVPQGQREKLKARYKELFTGNFFDTIFISGLNVKGEGTSDNPTLSLKGDVNAGPYRGRPVGNGSIQGSLSGKRLTVAAYLLDRKLSISGDVQLTDALPWNAYAELHSARYDFIAANFLKDVPDDLLINLRGNVSAHGDKNHISAVARIDEAHIYLYGTGLSSSKGIMIRLDDKKISISSLSLKSQTSEFRLSGAVSVGSDYDLLFEGSSSLSPLKAFSKNIDVISGNASFVFAVTGDWNNPKINGDMDITNGTLALKNIRYRLSSVSAYLYFDEDRVILERADGKLSGGDVTATGNADFKKFTLKQFLLNSRLRHVTASVSKDFWGSFDADLNYRGTLEFQSIIGDIDIKRAKYAERIEWKSWLLGLRQKERPLMETSKLDTTNLNIRVSGSNLVIDNNVAKASARMDILLKGTIGHPLILGRVETKEGFVYFRNNEFKILQAAVDFSTPDVIKPYFTIVAETRVRNYTIRLSLNGFVSQFNMTLSSDPFLAEGDIFSLLTVGQTTANLKGLEGGIGAGEATSFLTGKMQDVMEERLKSITGLDRLSIEPSVLSKSPLTTSTMVSKSTGTVSPRVTISKRLLGDKLYATYSAAAGSGEEQVWKLEYILGKNVSLVGDRDEIGSIGGDIKFRFSFK